MTPEEIRLVQSSYASIEPVAEPAAELFYRRLFEIAPAVKPLFNGDMRVQGQMLMSAIGLVVHNLETPDKVLGTVEKLGQRHVDHGARPEHYPVVGDALLWALQQGLGEQFTPAHRDAWSKAYALLSGLMIKAQESARRESAA